ncbi:MAG: hypothetical protein ACQETE_07980 [Bacteroidota bacterium]
MINRIDGIISRNIKYKYLGSYIENKFQIYTDLWKDYQEYISTVSTPDMAVSMEAVTFVINLVNSQKCESVLDLGTGFSSFAFRKSFRSRSIKIDSFDDNREWLQKSIDFSDIKGVGKKNFFHFDDFEQKALAEYDLVFHDLGRMDVRKKSLNNIINHAKKGSGYLFLDDMHKKDYANHVDQIMRNINYSSIDVKSYTIDSYGRYAKLIQLK